MERNDTTFFTEEGIFNYRVGAIILHDNKVLMVHNKNLNQYYSVGGRCKMHETSEQAIIRECREETGIDFSIDSLCFIHENFFIINNKKYHEISFLYHMNPLDDINKIGKNKIDLSSNEHLVWVDLDRISEIPTLYPDFFKTESTLIPKNIKHIITKQY